MKAKSFVLPTLVRRILSLAAPLPKSKYFAQLAVEEVYAQTLALKPEVVLLGTGDKLRFPHPSLTRAFAEARIGIEVMDLQAACRTYNILMAEERKVAAALLFL